MIKETLDQFILQANGGSLTTSQYPKEILGLKMKVSFGMGSPAKIPWMAFINEGMSVSNGIYPVYLYYKEYGTLILAYGVSETHEFSNSWPSEITNNTPTVNSFFDQNVRRYGDSFVFKAYKIMMPENSVEYKSYNNKELLSGTDLNQDLNSIINYYLSLLDKPIQDIEHQPLSQAGLFYMEKQLEDFIIHNWSSTELSKDLELIIEDGEMISQQYRTEIGPIDILAKDKKTGGYVVIELKKNQTSDDTVGQLARYMGWVKETKNDPKVRGIIIAGEYDKKLDFALKMVGKVEVYLYKVDFTLHEFKNT